MKSLLHLLSFVSIFTLSPAQGPLTPPPGADPTIGPVNALTAGGLPQPTMKTLHQVEPRTAIPGGTAGVIISTSGAYYLAGNITVATGDGITINASNVTLDLNGFSISSSAAPAAGIGIAVTGTTNLVISNGSIDGGFIAGVAPPNGMQTPRNVRVQNLTVSNCTNWGVLLEISKNTRVDGCLVDGAVGGIQATLVHDCSVTLGSIAGRIVRGSSVSSASLAGITADIVENCYAQAAGTAIQAKCLVNSYGTGGGDHDVISAGVAQNVWAEGGSGAGDGIEASVVSNSLGNRSSDLAGSSSGSGIKSAVIAASSGSSADGNALDGTIIFGAKGRALTGAGASGVLVANSYVESDGLKGVQVPYLVSGSGIVVGTIGRTNRIGDNNAQTTAIFADTSLIANSLGTAPNNGAWGIANTGGVVSGSLGDGGDIGITTNLLDGSLGSGSTPTITSFRYNAP